MDVSFGMPYLVTGTSACPEGQNPSLCMQGYAVSVRLAGMVKVFLLFIFVSVIIDFAL
jgi:hypothetical protein